MISKTGGEADGQWLSLAENIFFPSVSLSAEELPRLVLVSGEGGGFLYDSKPYRIIKMYITIIL